MSNSELTPRQRQRVDEILTAALAAPREERESIVRKEAGDEEAVLTEALSLLRQVQLDAPTGDALGRLAALRPRRCIDVDFMTEVNEAGNLAQDEGLRY